MDATTMAVDLAKDVFEVAWANRTGRILDRKRLTRRQFERAIDTACPGTTVLMESCGTAHYWGRRCQARGVTVRLLPAQYVRPYVRRNKTDRTDTEALIEADRCRRSTAGPREDGRATDAAGATPRADAVAIGAHGPHQRFAGPAPGAGCGGAHGRTTLVTRVAGVLADDTAPLTDLLRHTLDSRGSRRCIRSLLA